MIKTIVFDLDNTLIEWKDEYIYVLSDIVKSYNLGYDDKKIKELDNALTQYDKKNKIYTKENFLKFLNDNCNTNLPLDFVDKLIIGQGECFEPYTKKQLDTIKYLSSKYKLICITNWFTYTQKKRLEGVGILKYFDLVLGGDKHELKPSLKAFDAIKNPKECVMVGDNLDYDIYPALELGMKAIVLTKKDIPKDLRYQKIKKLEELKEIL